MNFSQIKRGSVVAIWHHPKGHKYVVAGEDTANRKLLLVKLNCLNNDGSIHKATRRFHRAIPYTIVGGNRVVKGVTRVLGQKDIRSYNFKRLLDNYEETARPLKARRKFVCTPVTDNIQSNNY